MHLLNITKHFKIYFVNFNNFSGGQAHNKKFFIQFVGGET